MGNQKASVKKKSAVAKKPAKKAAGKKPAASARESLANRRRKELLLGSELEREIRVSGYAEGAMGASAMVDALLEICPPNQAASFLTLGLGKLVSKTGIDLSGVSTLLEKAVTHWDRIHRTEPKT